MFNAEIQDGCQKWRENDFWEKSPVDSVDTVWVKSFEIALSHSVLAIQRRNSRWPPKVVGNIVLQNITSGLCIYPVGQKFCRNRSIAPFARYMRFCVLHRNSRWLPKVVGKGFWEKSLIHSVGQKFRQNRSISLHFEDKHVFAFYAKIQDGRQKWRENDFWEKSPVASPNTLQLKNFVKIALSRSVSEINKKIDVIILLQIRK